VIKGKGLQFQGKWGNLFDFFDNFLFIFNVFSELGINLSDKKKEKREKKTFSACKDPLIAFNKSKLIQNLI